MNDNEGASLPAHAPRCTPEADRTLRWLLYSPGLHIYEPAIIHGDFGSSNILFDTNGISGIMDFGFAGYSDPAIDIATVSTFGDPFFARICQFYPVTESTLMRAKFYCGTYALYEALHGFKNNDKNTFESGMEQYV